MTLDELRLHLDDLDAQLIALIAERQRTSREIARVKKSTGYPTRDFEREREVVLGARRAAEEAGVPPALAERIIRLLIRSSLATQERASVMAHGAGSGQRALVIGGAGRMGGWFVEFLLSQGFEVEVTDPAGCPAGATRLEDWRHSPLTQDFIVVASPLGATDGILQELAEARPSGVVFDLGSLKSPLRPGLMALKAQGCRVASVHPMFGPDTELLSGRHVIFIDLGVAEALERVKSLFAPTMAELFVMSLDEHDRLIAYVLGLSHAVNIAFFSALADSGEAAPRLALLSSTTFDAQLDVATRVAQENPALYFEIQALNDYGAESLDALSTAVERLRAAVRAGDAATFSALMLRGREYLDDRRSVAERRA